MADAGQVKTDQLDAQAEARRRIALTQIRQYPDPALRIPAKHVDEFDDDLARLVARMTRLMTDANGIGLAATQVGVLRRVFVFRDRDEEEAHVAVNPRITVRGDETAVDEEGCLSLPGLQFPTRRAMHATVRGFDQHGEPIEVTGSGFLARALQHEYDHLDGRLYVDTLRGEVRRTALRAIRAADWATAPR